MTLKSSKFNTLIRIYRVIRQSICYQCTLYIIVIMCLKITVLRHYKWWDVINASCNTYNTGRRSTVEGNCNYSKHVGLHNTNSIKNNKLIHIVTNCTL